MCTHFKRCVSLHGHDVAVERQQIHGELVDDGNASFDAQLFELLQAEMTYARDKSQMKLLLARTTASLFFGLKID